MKNKNFKSKQPYIMIQSMGFKKGKTPKRDQNQTK